MVAESVVPPGTAGVPPLKVAVTVRVSTTSVVGKLETVTTPELLTEA